MNTVEPVTIQERSLQPEILDHLPSADPRSRQSRRDLRRLNRMMCSAWLIRRELDGILTPRADLRLAELGSGDGRLALDILGKLAQQPPRPASPAVARKGLITLVDRQPVVEPETREAFRRLGWDVSVAAADVFEWFRAERGPFAGMIANLFLHHFNGGQLAMLLRESAARTSIFVALEPRRGKLPLLLSRMIGLIGCNAVTRHDAIASVRAGFARDELSRLWPDGGNWELTERPVGWFSHLFVARRKE